VNALERLGMAELSDQLTRSIRTGDSSEAATVRNTLDRLAGRTKWKPQDGDRPPADWEPPAVNFIDRMHAAEEIAARWKAGEIDRDTAEVELILAWDGTVADEAAVRSYLDGVHGQPHGGQR
jgi:hypothetical protein